VYARGRYPLASTGVEHIGARELRAELASFLRRAERGERVVVTVGGRPVAQLAPLDGSGPEPTLDDLNARGLVTAPQRRDRPAPPVRIQLWAGARLDRVLSEIR
jgi:prevent-host-death family protein